MTIAVPKDVSDEWKLNISWPRSCVHLFWWASAYSTPEDCWVLVSESSKRRQICDVLYFQ